MLSMFALMGLGMTWNQSRSHYMIEYGRGNGARRTYDGMDTAE